MFGKAEQKEMSRTKTQKEKQEIQMLQNLYCIGIKQACIITFKNLAKINLSRKYSMTNYKRRNR